MNFEYTVSNIEQWTYPKRLVYITLKQKFVVDVRM